MSEKKRYLIGSSGSSAVPQSMETVLDSFADEEGVQPVRKLKTGKRVLELTEEQVLKLLEKRPDLVIEEDLELEMFSPMPGLSPRVPADAELTLAVKDVMSDKVVTNKAKNDVDNRRAERVIW